MKAVILSLLAMSCSKMQVKENCAAVGYLIDVYEKGQLIRTDTSIWWSRVCGEELTRFEAMPRQKESICGTQDSIYLVIV